MEPVLDVDRFEVGYPDVLTLMRDLKAIGAHNVTAGRPRALAGRERLTRVQRAYEAFRRDEGLPATYEVIYGAGWGAAGRPASAPLQGVVHIAPGSIRRTRP
jgi:malonyl-CoA O-methyltransferase